MKFDTIQFETVDDCPWVESTIDRIIFQDCSVSVLLSPDGYFDQASEDEPDPSEPVTLTASLEVTGKLVEEHQAAFTHFVENAARYEERLLEYLLTKAKENAKEALETDDSDELLEFVKEHGIDTASGLKHQISWSGLCLFDHGWEGVGFITVDFACGWDEEHGISILMHRGKIIAESGLADFSGRGDSLLGHAKCIQEFKPGYDIALP